MNDQNILVSVITPCKNAARWLDTCIQSVRDQDFQDWELLVVDDASTDESPAIVEAQVEKDNRIKLLRLSESLGGSGARNHAIRQARGRYIAFLDADDWWLPQKLSSQIAFMEKGELPFTYTAYEKVDVSGELQGRVFHPPLELNYVKLLRSCAIGCSTVMLDTKILGRRYLPDLPRSHDYALWLELLREGYVAKGIDEPLTVYREHSGSLSSNKLSKLKMAWQIYRNHESFNLLISSFLLTSYVIHGLRKRFI